MKKKYSEKYDDCYDDIFDDDGYENNHDDDIDETNDNNNDDNDDEDSDGDDDVKNKKSKDAENDEKKLDIIDDFIDDVFYEKYDEYTDWELVCMFRGGDEDVLGYLLKKYKNLIFAETRPYYIPGGDRSDCIQEGWIGFYKAVMSYDESREASFPTFAKQCISRKIKSAIKAANRKKHNPLNTSVPIQNETKEGDFLDEQGKAVSGLKRLGIANPEQVLIQRELFSSIKMTLSPSEKKVFELLVSGLGYKEIAEKLGISDKSADNAITRIRKKAKTVCAQE